MTDSQIDEVTKEETDPKSPDEIERAKRAKIVAFEAQHALDIGLPHNIVIEHVSGVARGLGASTSGPEESTVEQK